MKIRFHTWYWGKWVLNGQLGLKVGDPGVELYFEDLHGWHHSEEFKNGT